MCDTGNSSLSTYNIKDIRRGNLVKEECIVSG